MTETASAAAAGPLSPAELDRLAAAWRAANYPSVGQIDLGDDMADVRDWSWPFTGAGLPPTDAIRGEQA
jgi:phosphoketolase